MNRRTFLNAATGLALSPLGDRTASAAAVEPKPWFDPSYGVLPTPENKRRS